MISEHGVIWFNVKKKLVINKIILDKFFVIVTLTQF